jgi:hypothetical protein
MLEAERTILLDALARTRGNQVATAEVLGLPLRTLVQRLARHGLRRKDLGVPVDRLGEYLDTMRSDDPPGELRD